MACKRILDTRKQVLFVLSQCVPIVSKTSQLSMAHICQLLACPNMRTTELQRALEALAAQRELQAELNTTRSELEGARLEAAACRSKCAELYKAHLHSPAAHLLRPRGSGALECSVKDPFRSERMY